MRLFVLIRLLSLLERIVDGFILIFPPSFEEKTVGLVNSQGRLFRALSPYQIDNGLIQRNSLITLAQGEGSYFRARQNRVDSKWSLHQGQLV